MKIIMLKGLPASGKSTKAAEIVSQGNWVRVNRDLIRTMLHFDKWTPQNENLTIEAEKAIVATSITEGRNVVIDDTNLGKKHEDMWKHVADHLGVTFEVIDVDTPYEVCINRDVGREKEVGAHVILRLALQYELYPKPEKPFVLCDLDGTIADCEHRRHHLSGEVKDWKAFFSEMDKDTPRLEIIDQLMSYEGEGHPVIFVSARPEDYREVTEAWLERVFNGYRPHITLLMRRSGDTRKDDIVKQEIYNTCFKNKYPIEVVFDDRPSIIRMWRENGLNVIDVGDGKEF